MSDFHTNLKKVFAGYMWLPQGAMLVTCAMVIALPLSAQVNQPEGAFRVIPQFPDESSEPGLPQNAQAPRAIVIQPDGQVLVPPTDSSDLSVQQPIDNVPAVLPGANGMDGLPEDATRPIALEVIYPAEREIMDSQQVDIFLKLDNYKLGQPDSGGNRLHYILNNDPPKMIYDAASPITLNRLSEGGHTIRVFAVQPDGRMIRDSEAYAIRRFYVIRKDFNNYTDPDQPYLTVNLPSVDEVTTDESGKMVFDYKLHNIEPGQGYELRYKIGAYEGYLSQDGPVYWSNLAPGKHQLNVELLRSGRQPVIGPFNQVQRIFDVKQVVRAVPVVLESESME